MVTLQQPSATASVPARFSRRARVMLQKQNELKSLKMWVWAYFILLVFEGALRKWVLPSLATPLLIVRDPVALMILINASKSGHFVTNGYIKGIMGVTVVSMLTALVFGHGNILVALFGARIFLLHFPLIFVIGQILSRADVIKIGRVVCWMSIPMTVLVAMQFYSPQTAFVNRGVGGDEAGAGFSGAMGYFRPSATFSFTNGLTLFYGMVSAYVFYFWMNPKTINKIVLIGASLSVVASIPLSISRGLLFQIGLTGIFVAIAIMRNPRYIGQMVLIAIAGTAALTILSKQSFFNTATEVLNERVTTANEFEGGLEGVLLDRYLGGLIGALAESGSQNVFGAGLGMGTNVGSMLLSGKVEFKVAEGEWGRLIGEMGPLFGIIVVLIRIGVAVKIALLGFKRVAKGDLLCWILVSYGFLNILQAQWAQPTSLGFSVLTGGLMIAALKTTKARK